MRKAASCRRAAVSDSTRDQYAATSLAAAAGCSFPQGQGQTCSSGAATRFACRQAWWPMISVRGIDRPRATARRGTSTGDLIFEPAPRVLRQRRIPDPGGRLVAIELGMVVRGAEGAWPVREPVKQVRAPERAVGRDDLRRRLAAAMLARSQLAQLDPGAMLHGGVIEVDLEPVPHEER